MIFFVLFPTYLHSILYTKMICFYTDISYCPIFDILWRYSFLLEIPWSLIYSSSVVSLLTCAHNLDTLLHSKALLPSIHTTVLVFFLSLIFYTLVRKQCGTYKSMLYVIKYVWNCYHLFDSFPFLYSSLKLHGTHRLSRGFIVYNKKYIIKCTSYLTLNALQVGRVHVYLKL